MAPASVDSAAALLSAEEQRCASRFAFVHDRRLYTLYRGARSCAICSGRWLPAMASGEMADAISPFGLLRAILMIITNIGIPNSAGVACMAAYVEPSEERQQ